MRVSLAWSGDGAPRMEVAHVERRGGEVLAVGAQIGVAYELRYRLEPGRLSLDVLGDGSRSVELGDADFFDLGWSPLFNSLPVMRDGLLQSGPQRLYSTCWVDVPSLEVSRSAQRYEPLGSGLVHFSAGKFSSDIQFDEAGFVLDYPGIATRA